jgi:redox-sensitive bicupin YhaK (pirin superfamily)
MSQLQLIIQGKAKDLGGFSVHRVLPYASHRMVGPFIFFDHMGPAQFGPGQGISVRPHPHIGLATVSYLFEGKIRHRDSLGSDQVIEPGAINWMTAGRGIVHSERTPDEFKEVGSALNGIQCWVALPEEYEDVEPSFKHHPSKSLPEFRVGEAQLKLLLGSAYGQQSPVKIHSDLFYIQVKLSAGGSLPLDLEDRETAVYVVKGSVKIDGEVILSQAMAVIKNGEHPKVEAVEESLFLILGGKSVGKRFIYWNFVSSSQEKIAAAKEQWAREPGAPGSPFPKVPGDDEEFIPLPAEPASGHVKGTVM